MALDRTWFNELVDDDGSNTVGSVWNKYQIQRLLDSVDTELAKLIRTGAWTPILTGVGGGSGQTYYQQSGTWHRAGTEVHAYAYVQIALKGTMSGDLALAGLPFLHSPPTGAFAVSTVWASGLVGSWSYLVAHSGPTTGGLKLMGNKTPGVATSTPLTAADLQDGTAFMINLCYHTNDA
jgi:hypothetical protein